MMQLFAQIIPEDRQPFEMFVCYGPSFAMAFIWTGVLLAFVYLLQLILHLKDGMTTEDAAPSSINPAVVLKVAVLYLVASFIVVLHSANLLCADMVAAGGAPDPIMVYAGINEMLKIIMLGLIGLFVGLFDYFCFAGKYNRLRSASNELNNSE